MRRRWIPTEVRSRLAVATLLVLAASAASAAAADEVEVLRRENAQLTARVRELEAELAALRAGAPAGDSAADPAAPGTRREQVYIPRSRVSLEVTRDEASGATSLATQWYRTVDAGVLPRKEWIQLRAQQGAAGELEGVWLLIDRQGGGGGKVTSGRLTVDGTVVELPVADYDVKRKSQSLGPISSSSRDERIRFSLPPAALAQVAAARTARFDAGTITFELSDEHVAAFTAMAARVGGAPAAQAASAAAPDPR